MDFFPSLWMNTMNRCKKTIATSFFIANFFLLTLGIANFHQNAAAQTGERGFPAKALRGTLVVQAPPEVLLDGRADRLSPGARIRDTRNLLTLSASLVGHELNVNYVRDGAGLIHEVWILTPEEAAQKRPGRQEGRNFVFASDTDGVKRDDGKTPFNQLPVYPNR